MIFALFNCDLISGFDLSTERGPAEITILVKKNPKPERMLYVLSGFFNFITCGFAMLLICEKQVYPCNLSSIVG